MRWFGSRCCQLAITLGCLGGYFNSSVSWAQNGNKTNALLLACSSQDSESESVSSPLYFDCEMYVRKLIQMSGIKAAKSKKYAAEVDVPLDEALLSQSFPIVFDESALEEEGIELSEIRVRHPWHSEGLISYLNALTQMHNLDWVLHDEYIVVTASRSVLMEISVYDITDLLPREERRSANSDHLKKLIFLLKQAISMDEWDTAGGTATISAFEVHQSTILVVSARPKTLLSIYHLFNRIRVVAGLEPKRRPRHKSDSFDRRMEQRLQPVQKNPNR